MELVISNKLKNSLKKKNPKILDSVIKNFGVQMTPIEFINKMITRINFTYHLDIKTIKDINELQVDKSLDQYICHIYDDNSLFAEFVISSEAKWGNTEITQQLMPSLIRNLYEDPSYLVNDIKKFVYLTISRKNSNAVTKDLILSSLITLGFDIVDMYEENYPLPKPYIYVEQVIKALSESKNKNSSNDKSSLDLKNNVLTLNISSENMGQTSKYYALFILVILKLSKISFEYNGKKEDNIIKCIKRMFIGNNIKIPEGNGKNLLLYGAPGTGKSYYLKKHYKKNVHRITFYPDYDYTDFVGGIKPTLVNNKLTYKYIPGELLLSVVEAYEKPNEEVNLIIEEINRANASSVFGDVFQLLDRKDNGISCFSINNKDICYYLDQTFNSQFFKTNGFKLPGNLNILATMNPADQGVFTLDTAFKRRWNQKYVKIDWSELNSTTASKDILRGFDDTWVNVGKRLNDIMTKFNVEEDALLGPYFLSETEIKENNMDQLASKLLGYMWNDSLRYQRKEVFKYDTLSLNIENLENEGMNIFKV